MNKELLNQTLLRTIQYKFEDGIVELVMGGMIGLLGLYFYILGAIENTQIADWLSVSFALIPVGMWYLMQTIIRSLKEKFTFPRTGFVVYRKGPGNRAVLFFSILMVFVLMGGLVAFSQIKFLPEWNLLPPFSGFLMALVLGSIGFFATLPRFYVLAGISLLLGAAFTQIQLSNNFATSAYCAVMGIVLLVSGGVILKNYLHKNPSQTEA